MPELVDVIMGESIVAGLKSIAAAADPNPNADDATVDHCATVLYNLCAVEHCRDALSAQNVVPVLTHICEVGGGDARQLVIATLCNLSLRVAHEAIAEHCVELLCETIREPLFLQDMLNACAACATSSCTTRPRARRASTRR